MHHNMNEKEHLEFIKTLKSLHLLVDLALLIALSS